MDTFKNKTVLVTGASSGIGEAMAHDFAKQGAEVILTARSQAPLESLANKINANGGKAHVYICDLAQVGSAETLHQQITSANLHVDLLVNNASPASLAHRYALSMRDVSSVILGVKNRKELIECIEAEERGTLSQVEIQQIENCIKES